MTNPLIPQYDSALGKAIAILRAGHRLPISLAAELVELGYDMPSLHTAHLNQKA